jgi:Zinc finger C-x8-C-x5-C-x3-H type (and similar)
VLEPISSRLMSPIVHMHSFLPAGGGGLRVYWSAVAHCCCGRTFATTGTCPYGKRCKFIHYSKGMEPVANEAPAAAVLSSTMSVPSALLGTAGGPTGIFPNDSGSEASDLSSAESLVGGECLAPLRGTGHGQLGGAVFCVLGLHELFEGTWVLVSGAAILASLRR